MPTCSGKRTPERTEFNRTAPPLIRRGVNDYDKMSVEEMCAPLSARVTPSKAFYSISGGEKPEGYVRSSGNRWA